MSGRVVNGEMLVRLALMSIVAGALCLASVAPGRAAQVSQSMNLSLTIGTPGGQVSLLVGSLMLAGPASGPASGSTIVHVTAPANLPYLISLDSGLHYPNDVAHRLLVGNGKALPYYLYKDQAHHIPWWIGTGTSVFGNALPGVGTGSDQAYTVFGLTSAYSAVGGLPDGTYTDVVTAAVDF
jgi:spore coat protein U-like protein